MAPAASLIDLLVRLLNDPAALADFRDHPDAVLAQCGLTGLTPDDVRDALVLADHPDSDSRSTSTSHHSRSHHDSSSSSHHVAPAPHHHSGGSEHDAAIRYINDYVTNNYVDDRDTFVDHSINQRIDTGGGDLDQTIDTTTTTASGDGAVAAGGAIDGSAVTTGSGNQVGDDNVKGDGNINGDDNQAVSGDHNTTAFGTGAANNADISHSSVTGGGALSIGDAATGTHTSFDSHDQSDTSDTTTSSVDGSFNTHADQTTGSHNDTSTHDDTDSHNSTHNDLGSHDTLHVDATAAV